jgi:hypothetical protein
MRVFAYTPQDDGWLGESHRALVPPAKRYVLEAATNTVDNVRCKYPHLREILGLETPVC